MRRQLTLLACGAYAACADASVARDAADAAEPVPACVREAPEIRVSADPAAPVPAGTQVTYTLTIEDRDGPGCEPSMFSSSVSPSLRGLPFRVEPEFIATPLLEPGQSARVELRVTSHPQQDAGSYPLDFFVRAAASGGSVRARTQQASYAVRAPEGCHVAVSHELMILEPAVVDDARRTSAAEGGSWSFGELMRRAARRPEDAPRLVEDMLLTFTREQSINGQVVAARPNLQPLVLEPWPRTPDGALDLTRAPLRLLAIVHRLDLGEGRFVFGVLDRVGGSLLFTLILEYQLPGSASDWAQRVHALGAQPFPDEDYRSALQAVTDRFTARGAAPERPNGSALLRVRSNENALGQDGRWEMRELRLSADSGELEPSALALTPGAEWNGSRGLARFIEDHRQSILDETHQLPARLDGQPFLAGSLINTLGHWEASGLQDAEARRKFSLNTCDGCHGGETFTSFFQVFPRAAGEQSRLSAFLTGTQVRDPVTGEQHAYNELARRRELLERAVCGADR